MRAKTPVTFECEAAFLHQLVHGEPGPACSQIAQGHMTMCVGSVVETNMEAGVLVVGHAAEVKVLQPLEFGVDVRASGSGWITHHEKGSILILCRAHEDLVEQRVKQLAQEKEQDGNDNTGVPGAGGEEG